jgi:hypothetical protein
MSTSSLPGVKISTRENPALVIKHFIPSRVIKLRCCGGATLLEFSQRIWMSNPEELNVVNSALPFFFKSLRTE